MEDNKNGKAELIAVIRAVHINANDAFTGITSILSGDTIDIIVNQLIYEVIKEIIRDDLKSTLQATYKKHKKEGKV